MYIGLLNDKTEPSHTSGYARVEGDLTVPVFFPVSKGYGLITHIAVFDTAEGGDPVETIELAAPVDCHEGVTPFIHDGKLLRGMAVSARGVLRAAGECKTGNIYGR